MFLRSKTKSFILRRKKGKQKVFLRFNQQSQRLKRDEVSIRERKLRMIYIGVEQLAKGKNPKKSYVMQTNWKIKPDNRAITIDRNGRRIDRRIHNN